MDYRSNEATYINSLFMQGQMTPITRNIGGRTVGIGFQKSATNIKYYRTTEDRLVRLDNGRDYNVLSADKQSFDPLVGGLRPFESIDTRRALTRAQLVPPPGYYEFGRDKVLPKVGLVALSFAVGRGLISLWGYANQLSAAHVAGTAGVGVMAHQHLAQQADDADAHVALSTPGTVDNPILAPNGCLLDGTPESAAAAMLPGGCASDAHFKPEFLSNSAPIDLGYIGYGNPVGTVLNETSTLTDKIVIGSSVGLMGAAALVVSRDPTTTDRFQTQLGTDRRQDAARPGQQGRRSRLLPAFR